MILTFAKWALRGGANVRIGSLEPISKLSEQDTEAGELNKAQKVLWVVFPANEETALPLYPCEEALDEPTSLVSSQPPSILGLHRVIFPCPFAFIGHPIKLTASIISRSR